jgi:hypothetical protein
MPSAESQTAVVADITRPGESDLVWRLKLPNQDTRRFGPRMMEPPEPGREDPLTQTGVVVGPQAMICPTRAAPKVLRPK